MELCSEGERTVMAMLLLLCGTVTVLSTHYIYTVKEKGVHSCWLCFHLAILNLFSVIIIFTISVHSHVSCEEMGRSISGDGEMGSESRQDTATQPQGSGSV